MWRASIRSIRIMSPAFRRLAHELMANGLSQADATRAATAELYRTLGQQAQMLSYIDVFHVLMWVVIAVLPLVLLLKKPDKLQGGGGAAA